MGAIKNIFLNDRIIFGLIALNAIFIFFQGFPELGDQWQYYLAIADDIISVLFIFEVLVKIQHYGLKNYLGSNWNRFDVLLILLSIPSILLHFFHIEDTANISFLLVCRVFRVFKFFRFMQFFPQVEHIFRSVREALRASFLVLVGFFVFVFIMAIISCFFYQKISPEYFANPILSYYSTFKVFTVEGWNAIPDDICANGKLGPVGAFFTKLYFIMLLVIGGIFGLSIVNSIFVDAMVSDNNDDLERQVDDIDQRLKTLDKKMERVIALLEQQQNISKSGEDQIPPDSSEL